MTRIDWLVLNRLAGRIGMTLLVLFSLICLVETVNVWRFQHLASIGGPLLGILAIVVSASIWCLSTLPVTFLLGTMLGILDLQARREFTIISTSGVSIWRAMRAPLLAVMLFGIVASVVADTAVVQLTRALSINLPQASSSGTLWLEQRGGEHTYTMVARHPHQGGLVLEDVTFFLPAALYGSRIEARRVELRQGAWHIVEGTRFQASQQPHPADGLDIPTASGPGDIGARLASPGEMTLLELLQVQSLPISDTRLKSGIDMRLLRLVALPMTLAASLVIAFAFTSGYRRTNKYGVTVLYGVVLGFVVYVVTEMAAIAGSAGVLEPAFAAFAPAIVAFVIGTTVLLYREDGRR